MSRLALIDVIGLWEAGNARPESSKALAVLAPMFPESDPTALASLSVGQRNAGLLALRQDVIGPVLRALVTCPECGEPLEFEQRIDELLDGYAAPATHEFAVTDGAYTAHCRLVTAGDLVGLSGSGSEEAAREALIAAAVLRATCHDAAIAIADLPVHLLDRIAEDMEARDPLAIVAIPLACAACDHVWPATLEIMSFLWAEIDRQARLVLTDVVRVARAYGWSEAEIIGMSPARRQYYLDAIEQP